MSCSLSPAPRVCVCECVCGSWASFSSSSFRQRRVRHGKKGREEVSGLCPHRLARIIFRQKNMRNFIRIFGQKTIFLGRQTSLSVSYGMVGRAGLCFGHGREKLEWVLSLPPPLPPTDLSRVLSSSSPSFFEWILFQHPPPNLSLVFFLKLIWTCM